MQGTTLVLTVLVGTLVCIAGASLSIQMRTKSKIEQDVDDLRSALERQRRRNAAEDAYFASKIAPLDPDFAKEWAKIVGSAPVKQ